MLPELLKNLKKLFSRKVSSQSPKKSLRKKRGTWETIGRKYKKLPYWTIEGFDTGEELWFYQQTPVDPLVTKYKLPLRITQIAYIGKFFPAEGYFFKRELLKAFNRMKKYERK